MNELERLELEALRKANADWTKKRTPEERAAKAARERERYHAYGRRDRIRLCG